MIEQTRKQSFKTQLEQSGVDAATADKAAEILASGQLANSEAEQAILLNALTQIRLSS